jgi:hypothetical protein
MNFYDNIRVVYIPSTDTSEAAIVLQQLDAFERELREEHKVAFERRQRSYLAFKPQELMSILGRALKGFSANPDWFINWAFEAPRNSDVLFDLWSNTPGIMRL